MPSEEAYKEADYAIAEIRSATGIDYANQRDEIAPMISDYLWNGNWDCTTDFDEPGKRNLRFIEENEYDQSMDDDEKPTDQICYAGWYIFFAD